MDTHHPQPAATIEAGLEALAQGAWEEARSAFESALRADESPGALEGLGMAATGLSMDHFLRGEHAVATGWVQRAHRLLEGLQQCPELGWLAIWEAHMALMADHDLATAQCFSAQALSLGKSLRDIDLEMLALVYEGFALVSQGKISEGMRRSDDGRTCEGGDATSSSRHVIR